MDENYIDTFIITLTIVSDDNNLINQGNYYKNSLKNCEIEYIEKGEFKIYNNGKISKLKHKNSTLYIKLKSSNYNYNKDIIELITVFEKQIEYFKNSEYDAYILIDIYHDKNYSLSLEFGNEVLKYLCKHKFSLPISCYINKNDIE
jgi:hypothetical protein